MRISPLQTNKDINNKFSFNSVQKPKQNFNCKTINNLSNYYYLPLSFSGNRTYSSDKNELFEVPSHFLIGKCGDVPCPACGRKMLNQNQFLQFKEELNAVDESEYINVLEKWQDYMMPVELQAFEDIKQTIKKHTDMRKPNDLRTALVILRHSKLTQLQAIQMRRVKKMRSLAKSLPEEEKAVLKLSEEGKNKNTKVLSYVHK